MSRHEQEQVSPERLVEAAEAALMAAAETAELSGGEWPYPADLMGHADQPACLCPFTRWEIEQACMFLVRMGMLEPRRTAR